MRSPENRPAAPRGAARPPSRPDRAPADLRALARRMRQAERAEQRMKGKRDG